MTRERAYAAVLTLFFLVGLAAAFVSVAARAQAEGKNRTVEIVADEADFGALARSQGLQPLAFFRRLRAAGVTGLGVEEDTLTRLSQEGLVAALSGGELASASRLGAMSPDLLAGHAIEPDAVYAISDDRRLAAWLAQQLAARLGRDRVASWSAGGRYVVVARGDPEALSSLGLGFRPGRLKALSASGLALIPRWKNAPRLSAEAIGAEIDRSAAEVPLRTVIFAQDQALGYPDHLAATAAGIVRHGLVVGVVETPEQLGNVDRGGLRALDALDGERTVRVFSVPGWMVQRLPPSSIVTSLVESAVERNIRVFYLHPDPRGPDPIQRNLALWSDLAESLRRQGFHLGPAQPFPPLAVHAVGRLLMIWAAAAAGLVLWGLLGPKARTWPWVVLGLTAAGASALVSTQLSRLAAALVAAVSLPSLAAIQVALLWTRPSAGAWRRAFWTAVVASATSIAGGLLVAGLLGDTPHLLEWSYFRGVKLTFLMPPLVAAAAGLVVLRRQGLKRALWEAGDEWVRVRHLVLGALVLAAAGVYLLRSGNVPVSLVPAIEVRLRYFLAQTLVYRPREKEFLVGYPSLFLAAWAASRRRPEAFFLFLLGASAAPVSIADSFEHLRTPVLVSLWRSVYGLLTGGALGSLALLAVAAAERVVRRWSR